MDSSNLQQSLETVSRAIESLKVRGKLEMMLSFKHHLNQLSCGPFSHTFPHCTLPQAGLQASDGADGVAVAPGGQIELATALANLATKLAQLPPSGPLPPSPDPAEPGPSQEVCLRQIMALLASPNAPIFEFFDQLSLDCSLCLDYFFAASRPS